MSSRGETLWVGKCIHCGAKLAVGLDGALHGTASIEHIVPRSHGGTDDPRNLALACARCNHEKGRRHDVKARNDPQRLALVEELQRRRTARWR